MVGLPKWGWVDEDLAGWEGSALNRLRVQGRISGVGSGDLKSLYSRGLGSTFC